ncbi:hypothetical protein amrb99_62020 [Actinomadura sp. RB99]|uniref:hypothetical protein n=1 Tax=Actinomadura sp. RB99 TaxID=2691577 RepID=UPI0016872245|nr:hypothetical protein [Actinomadura sp. RB99]MBD2897243.1 hypothetical protein [Actinomadura sp. RB99]
METEGRTAPAALTPAEQMRNALLRDLRETFPDWQIIAIRHKPHPWRARRTLKYHDLGGALVIEAKDAEILRELIEAARDIDAKISGTRP